MDKDFLRKDVLQKRDALSVYKIEIKSREIFEELVATPEYAEASNILIYASVRSEVKTDEIILDALALGKRVFCPKVTDKNNGIMKFVRIYEPENLVPGYYGIREPEITEKSEIFDPDFYANETNVCQTDGENVGKTLVIVPGVAFDEKGNRIGYKGGYYDRFLPKVSYADTVALCYKVQIVDEIKSSEYDIPVKSIIHEK
ncbi:MAG: 5-formyltetrahydrofolate cyclo-ligase [Butyrivibrio sp.]|nr:5-formyltetrahydrofolate cyclo-ligase [Butyrivibrio sp.]